MKFQFPSFWRFHHHTESSKCDCCPTPHQTGVVVKRRTPSISAPSSNTTNAVANALASSTLPPSTSSNKNKEPEPEQTHAPQQSPIDIREQTTDHIEKQQSPIDIHEGESDHIPMGACTNAVTIAMGHGDASLEYDGHGFHVVWSTPGNNTLTIEGKVYHAVQFHFHTPSEHTLDGVHEELEMHLVHQSKDGGFAVLAVLIREGKTCPFLSQFWDGLADIQHHVPATIPLGTINPSELDITSSSFFRYCGSLTTPPYTEGVEWVVIHDVMEASREQLDMFHNALPGTNARDLQPLNHRHVWLAC